MISKTAKTSFVLIACMLLVATAMLPICYADKSINHDKTGSIAVQPPFEGCNMKLYRIADWTENLDFVAISPFTDYQVNVSKAGWQTLADTLTGYVCRDHIPADREQVGYSLQQYVRFKNLSCGLYLIISDPVEINTDLYVLQSFVVSIPTNDYITNTFQYHVIAEPKCHRRSAIETINLSVTKLWVDNGVTTLRSNEIEVQLLCNDEIFDTVILNADNNWSYSWEELDGHKHWTTVEKVVPKDYNVAFTQDKDRIFLTNSLKTELMQETPSPTPTSTPTPTNTPDTNGGKLPQTGQLWWPVPILATCGLCFIMLGLVMQKRQ